jgi:hypothetical protein
MVTAVACLMVVSFLIVEPQMFGMELKTLNNAQLTYLPMRTAVSPFFGRRVGITSTQFA